MKRDWELIRKILLALEALGDTQSALHPEDIKKTDPEAVAYQMRILAEAGLIVAESTDAIPYALRLTWGGHELLDQLRNESVWNRVKALAREKAIPLSFDAIKFLATKVLTGGLG